jgi:hypothetical protein
MPGNDQVAYFLYDDSRRGLIVEVAADQDYFLEDLQLRLLANGGSNATVQLFTDGDTEPGTFIADLGTHPVGSDRGNPIVTFSPVGSIRLLAGQRYWFVVSTDLGLSVFGPSPGVDPSGIFTFIDHRDQFFGYWFEGNQAPAMTIHAFPAPPMPADSDGQVVVACTHSDGRLNSICEEPYQTAAIYCRADGSIDVYGITDGEGWLAFRTTQAEIDAVGVPAQNNLIERSDDGKIRLYRLSTGEFQVNAPMWDVVRGNLPDGYVFQFGGCQ